MRPIRTILVPTDYSRTGEHAVRRAYDLARVLGASVTVVHAVAAGRAGRREAADIRAEPGPDDLSVDRRLIEGESPDLAILDESGRGYDLVVLGTRGASPLRHLLLGSVAERVVRLSPAPVLTVPSPRGDDEERAMKLNKILCPIDFSEPSRVALDHASALARETGGILTVLHVIEPVVYPVEYGMAPVPTIDLETTATENARERLDALLRDVVGDGVAATAKVVLGRADDTICDVAESEGFDLIVLATHGLTGIKHLLLGSVAERVVRTARCPVLTVKGGDRS